MLCTVGSTGAAADMLRSGEEAQNAQLDRSLRQQREEKLRLEQQVASIYHDREALLAGREAEVVAQTRVLESAAALSPPRPGDEQMDGPSSGGAMLHDPTAVVRYGVPIPADAQLDAFQLARLAKSGGLRWGAVSGKVHTHDELAARVEAPIFLPAVDTGLKETGVTEPHPSLRWFSVARGGMQEAEDWTTEQRGGTRADKVAAIRRRRDNNVRHQPLRGEAGGHYESEHHRGEREAMDHFDPDQTRFNRAANRQHWIANTRTNYRFGQDKIEYSVASKMPDTMGHVGEYRGVLDPNFAQMLRRSALTDILKDNEGGRPLQTTNQSDLLDWSGMPAAERDQTRVLAVQLKHVLSRSSNPISQMNNDQLTTDYRDNYSYNYQTYPKAKRGMILENASFRSSNALSWDQGGAKKEVQESVTKTQLSDRLKWDAAQMPAFARQQAYLERLRNRRTKGSNHWTIGYDMAYY